MARAHFTDLRQAARSLARAPGFTAAAVLTLGVGLGLAAAIYAALKQIVIDPLPFPDADRLMVLMSDVPGSGTDDSWGASTAQFFHFRDNAESLDEIGVLQGLGPVNVQADGAEMRLNAFSATAATQRMIGSRAVLGRSFLDADDAPGAPWAAVVSEGYWRSQFGADPGLVGRTLRLDLGSEPRVVEVVGVVAATGSASFDDAGIWMSMQLDPAGPHYNQHTLFVMAKRRAGVPLTAAQAEIDGLTDQLADIYPSVYGTLELNNGDKVDFMTQFGFRSRWVPLKDHLVGGASAPLWIAQGAIAMLLIVAWVAIANLFLARVEAQRPEMAVRSALGARRGAIVRQLAGASLLVTIGAWAVGSALAWWLTATWVAVEPIDLPGEDIGISGAVLASTAGLALLVAVSMVGTALVRLRGVSGHLADAGRRATSSRSRQRARAALVVTQVALAFVLLVGAGLLLSSFRNLVVTDPGIDPRGAVKVRLVPDPALGSAWWPLLEELQDAVAGMPSVAAAGASSSLPFERGFIGCTAQFFEDPAVTERMNASNQSVCGAQDYFTPGYFAAAGIPLLQGRAPSVADFQDPAVRGAVVSRSFAEKFFPGESAIGKRLAPHGWEWFTILGVVGDIYATSVAAPPTPHVYYPLNGIPEDAGRDPLAVTLVVRANRAQPEPLLPTLRRQVETLSGDVIIADAGTLAQVVERSMGQDRFMALLLGFAGGAALLLAVIGLYGVVRYLVARRTHEIGVRMAVGALPERVRRMMVLASLKLVALGLVVGLVASLGLSGVLRGLLFGVAPTSPTVYAACAVLFVLAAALASWAAAGRAARITPMDALRIE